jgi:hypothetical protein
MAKMDNDSCGRSTARAVLRSLFAHKRTHVRGWRCVGPQTGYSQCVRGRARIQGCSEPPRYAPARVEQQIRFCTAPDGVRLAYAVHGTGPPIVRAATWLTHLEYDWESPVWRHWLEQLGAGHTLVRYDERGCGLSDRDVGVPSVDTWVSDLETVVAAAGLQRFSLLGVSQGVAIALVYATRQRCGRRLPTLSAASPTCEHLWRSPPSRHA